MRTDVRETIATIRNSAKAPKRNIFRQDHVRPSVRLSSSISKRTLSNFQEIQYRTL